MGLDDNFVVIVHLGAGHHSCSKKDMYFKLCDETCDLVINTFRASGRNILEAAKKGIQNLEDSGLVNAGEGSNKNVKGQIETDASLMISEPYSYAAIGAARNCVNPIIEAGNVLNSVHNDGSFSRVICGQNFTHVSMPQSSEQDILHDTVGLICVDLRSRCSVIGCSSGGPQGKPVGRVGPCALPGVGFWISEDGKETALCTGIGEQIAIKGGARAIIEALKGDSSFDEFLEAFYKLGNSSLEFGFIATSMNNSLFETFISHSTASFIYGIKSTDGFFNAECSLLSAGEKSPSRVAVLSIMQQVDAQLESLERHKKLIREHREKETKLRELRFGIKDLERKFQKSEDDIKALQSVGQIIGEVLKQIDDEKFIVKSSNGPRFIVGCRNRINKKKLVQGVRVTLDMTTLTIMRILPREVDPLVYNMSTEDPGDVSFEEVGGLGDQIRELREVIELPILNPELFKRIGVKAPKGVLLYGPPGTGKTLLARAVAASLDVNFLKVVSSAIVDKYIGESARVIREMFAYAKDHAPCIIFMDEIDAIGGRRFSEGNSSDREVQRTLMELLNQMDGFDELGQVKIIMATNRPDTLDPALLRPGRLDRKIEISLPNENGRADILRIHSAKINKQGEINFEPVVKLSEGFNGADLRNVVTEAGMFAIREERDYILQEDLLKAVRKVGEAKKLETKLDYEKV